MFPLRGYSERELLPRATTHYLIAILALLFVCAVPALGQMKVPKGHELIEMYPQLHKAAVKSKAVNAGREVRHSGRPKDGKLSWSLVKRESRRLWFELHPSYFLSTDYLYDVLKKKGVRPMVEAAFDQQHTPEYQRTAFRCIIEHESNYNPVVYFGTGGRPDLWYPHSPPYTNAVLGIMQFEGHWGTLAQRADPVWSILRALRSGREDPSLQPWYADRGWCHF